MRTKLHLVCAVLMTAGIISAGVARPALSQQLVIRNPLPIDRGEEVIEVPLSALVEHLHKADGKLGQLAAINAQTGEAIPTQLYGADPDGRADLLLLTHLKKNETIKVTFREHQDGTSDSKPVSQAAGVDALVFGREAPERKDDYAWENKIVTYRVYGPALEATGEITSGIDVWSKRTPNFVIDSFYQRDAEGQRIHDSTMSYHEDNGIGLDSYGVGPTRGCGGTAVWSGGKLIVSNNYTKLKTLSTGPLRFAFELTYAPWKADGRTYTETKRIELDAGSHLNRISSTFAFEGSGSQEFAAGIAVHEGADAAIPVEGGVASVWDTPQDASAGRIATGLVALPDSHGRTMLADKHALLIFERRSGQPFTYFAGSGWSKADMPTADAWNGYLETFLNLREHPVKVTWIKH